MKTIQVSESDWKACWKRALDRLELASLQEQRLQIGRDPTWTADELHRRFHYEVSCLRDELERA